MKILDAKRLKEAIEFAQMRPGESKEDFKARMLWAMQKPENQVPLAVGVSNRAEGVVPWQSSAKQVGTKELTEQEREEARQALEAELPPVRKRTGRQRVDTMLEGLVAEAERSYRLFGRVEFPKSMMDAIGAELWKMGLPEARVHLERYARDILEKAERKNRANHRAYKKDLVYDVTRKTFD